MQPLSRIGRVIGFGLRSPVADGLLPFVAGVAAVKWFAVATATVGGGPVAHVAAVTASSLALVCGGLLMKLLAHQRRTASSLNVIAAVLIVTSMFATRWLTSFGQAVLDGANEPLLASQSLQFTLLLKAFGAMFGAPALATGIVLFGTRSASSSPLPASRIGGFGLGLFLCGVVLSADWGRGLATTLIVLIGAVGLIATAARLGLTKVGEAQPTEASVANSLTRTARQQASVLALLSAICGAVAFVALARLSDQLAVATLWTASAKWSSVCIGMAFGLIAATRWRGTAQVWSGAIAAAACCLPVIFFGSLVGLCLEWSTFVESTAAQVALRSGLLCLLFAPLGIWIGVWSRSSTTLITGFAVGYLLASTSGLLSIGVVGLLQTALVGMLVIAATPSVMPMLSLKSKQDALSSLLQRPSLRLLAAGCLMLLLVLGLIGRSSEYRPALAAKLLFDTRVFVAHRIEQRTDILSHLDEARHVATTETGNGTLTHWRLGGPRVQLRQSGVLTATHSLDADKSPQVAAEALLVTLPLVLHERPNHVAVLGMRSGLAVESALRFTVQSLTCIESDQELSRVVQRDIWPQLVANPALDDRLSLLHAEPTLALTALPGSFDLIISNADQAVLAREASAYTAETYQRAAKALAPGGLFCQRMAVADSGRETVELVLATWQRAFQEIAVIETSVGEWLLVGANSVPVDPDVLSTAPIVSDQSLCFRRGLVERLQRAHVRRSLAAVGADWAAPLLLSTLVIQSPKADEAPAVTPANEAGNPLLTARLPFDVMRWGNKLDEINSAYGASTQPLAARLGADAETEEVTRRLTELGLQKQIVAQHPDEYWAYRKAVKKRLTEAPYSTIIQVKGERPTKDLHPSEKRRLSYFETLGSAAKASVPNVSQLAAVAAFAEPHDPLISPFMHLEVAALASKRPADGSVDEESERIALEWRHRMQAINFAEPNDRSVRNVAESIELLVKHGELIPQEADRGDQLDALLQALHSRWFARGAIAPQSSQVMLSDLEHSIAAIDLAFGELDKLSEARSLNRSEWESRKTALEKSLVQPLRHYRQMLIEHQAKERAKDAK